MQDNAAVYRTQDTLAEGKKLIDETVKVHTYIHTLDLKRHTYIFAHYIHTFIIVSNMQVPHTLIHTYIHTYIHIYIHTYILYIHTYT